MIFPEDSPNSLGRKWESEFFGICARWGENPPPYRKFYRAFNEAYKLQESFGWNSKVPKTPAALDLYQRVKEHLEQEWQLQGELGLYCTLGTSLDYWHHADGVFAFQGCLVAIDLVYCRSTHTEETNAVLVPKSECRHPEIWKITEAICWQFHYGLAQKFQKPIRI